MTKVFLGGNEMHGLMIGTDGNSVIVSMNGRKSRLNESGAEQLMTVACGMKESAKIEGTNLRVQNAGPHVALELRTMIEDYIDVFFCESQGLKLARALRRAMATAFGTQSKPMKLADLTAGASPPLLLP